MTDVVVTVPKILWREWLTEGGLPGDADPEWQRWVFGVPTRPDIVAGERVYIVAHGRLRGYAPLIEIDCGPFGKFGLVRGGGAVAVTIPQRIGGFRGYRYRWWPYEIERPFPTFADPGGK